MGNILLLHASAGSGHRSVATAIAAFLNKESPDTTVVDILDFGSPLFRLLYGKGYEWCAKHARWFIHAVFALTDKPRTHSMLVRAAESATAARVRSLLNFLQANRTSVACCTHFLPVALLCELRRQGLYQGRIHVCVTDYDVHGFWFDPDVDFYYVASQQAAARLQHWGVDAGKIAVSGIPVRNGFAPQEKPARSPLSGGGQGGHSRLRLLVVASSLRHAECLDILDEIRRSDVPATVHLVTGRNAALYRMLQQREQREYNSGAFARSTMRLKVHGLVQDMAGLMRTSDVLVSKPGGITVSEALVCGLPMLLVAPIPLHENHNAALIQEQGAGLLCFAKGALEQNLRLLAAHPAGLAQMRSNCLALARPYAAQHIGQRLLACAALQTQARESHAPHPSAPAEPEERAMGQSALETRLGV